MGSYCWIRCERSTSDASCTVSASWLARRSVSRSRLYARCSRNKCASLRRVAPAVAADAEVGLLLVAPEALDGAEAAAVFADHCARFGGFDLLVGAGLEELADPEAAGVARRAFGRQRVVGADHLVAVGNVGLGAEKEGTVILETLEPAVRLRCQHLDMFRGDAVGLGDHLVLV